MVRKEFLVNRINIAIVQPQRYEENIFAVDKGKVYGWGNSEYGQLPIKDDNCQVNIATEVNMCQELGHITDIAAGGSFCMVLNSKYNLRYYYSN